MIATEQGWIVKCETSNVNSHIQVPVNHCSRYASGIFISFIFRQVLHSMGKVGELKCVSAARALAQINPHCQVSTFYRYSVVDPDLDRVGSASFCRFGSGSGRSGSVSIPITYFFTFFQKISICCFFMPIRIHIQSWIKRKFGSVSGSA